MATPPLPPGIAAPVPEAPPASECNDLDFNLENVDKVGACGSWQGGGVLLFCCFVTFISYFPIVLYCVCQPRSLDPGLTVVLCPSVVTTAVYG